MQQRKNPYVGPRPFRSDETLYGRDEETHALFHLLQARRIVLLHSPSGAGKSSLIQAGLTPELTKARFDVWPTIRVNADARAYESLPANTNRYVLSVLLSLEEQIPAPHRRDAVALSKLDIASYLVSRPRSKRRAGDRVVLVFDQFEEVLTVDPLAIAQKEEFFRQLGEALAVPNYWALFAIREDYLGALAPYRDSIPSHLKNTFRLDLLGIEAAKQAIEGLALSEGRSFVASARLVRNLSMVKVLLAEQERYDEVPGLYVEPVQLQVVCRRLWDALDPEDQLIEEDDLKNSGDVDRSLAGYYADAVAGVAGKNLAVERKIREWFGEVLVVGGIRSQVRREAVHSGGLPNGMIEDLLKTYLIRAEPRAGVIWYELSHDRLVAPLTADNARWEQDHLRPFQTQAKLWEAQGRPDALLLASETIPESLRWAAENQTLITEEERQFLARSEETRKAENLAALKEDRAARRQRILTGVALFLMLVAVLVGSWAYRAKVDLEASLNRSTRSQILFLYAQMEVSKSQRQTETSLIRATHAQILAMYAQMNAEQERAEAERQRLLTAAALLKAEAERQQANQSRCEANKSKVAATDELAMQKVADAFPDSQEMRSEVYNIADRQKQYKWLYYGILSGFWPAARAHADLVGVNRLVPSLGPTAAVAVIRPGRGTNTLGVWTENDPQPAWITVPEQKLSGAVTSVAWDPKGDKLYFSMAGSENVWTVRPEANGSWSGTPTIENGVISLEPWSLATYDKRHTRWLVAGVTSSLRLDGEPLNNCPLGLLDAQFSPNGNSLVVLGADNLLHRWDIGNCGKNISGICCQGVSAFRFPDTNEAMEIRSFAFIDADHLAVTTADGRGFLLAGVSGVPTEDGASRQNETSPAPLVSIRGVETSAEPPPTFLRVEVLTNLGANGISKVVAQKRGDLYVVAFAEAEGWVQLLALDKTMNIVSDQWLSPRHGLVVDLAFSSDGMSLFTADDRGVRVWPTVPSTPWDGREEWVMWDQPFALLAAPGQGGCATPEECLRAETPEDCSRSDTPEACNRRVEIQQRMSNWPSATATPEAIRYLENADLPNVSWIRVDEAKTGGTPTPRFVMVKDRDGAVHVMPMAVYVGMPLTLDACGMPITP